MKGIDETIGYHTILPSQFYERASRNDVSAPIRRLMLAVLTDALDCLNGFAIDARGSARRLEARRAAQWIEQDGDLYLFSFNSVCETLGIDPDALRAKLRSWRASNRRLASRFHVVRCGTKVRAHRILARRAGATLEGRRETRSRSK